MWSVMLLQLVAGVVHGSVMVCHVVCAHKYGMFCVLLQLVAGVYMVVDCAIVVPIMNLCVIA